MEAADLISVRDSIRVLRIGGTPAQEDGAAEYLVGAVAQDQRVITVIQSAWRDISKDLAPRARRDTGHVRDFYQMVVGAIPTGQSIEIGHEDSRVIHNCYLEMLPPQERWRMLLLFVSLTSNSKRAAALEFWKRLRFIDCLVYDPDAWNFEAEHEPPLGFVGPQGSKSMEFMCELALSRQTLNLLTSLELRWMATDDGKMRAALENACFVGENFHEELTRVPSKRRDESRELRLNKLTEDRWVAKAVFPHCLWPQPVVQDEPPEGADLKVREFSPSEVKRAAVDMSRGRANIRELARDLREKFPQWRFAESTVRFWLEFDRYERLFKKLRSAPYEIELADIKKVPPFKSKRVRSYNIIDRWAENLEDPTIIGGITLEECIHGARDGRSEPAQTPRRPTTLEEMHSVNSTPGVLRTPRMNEEDSPSAQSKRGRAAPGQKRGRPSPGETSPTKQSRKG